MLALGATTPLSAQTNERDKLIADLEKELADLKQKLAELKKGSEAPPRPLQLSDAKDWRRIGTSGLSRDGQWFAYRVGPGEGDGEVIVKQTKGDKQYKFPGGDGTFGQISFSADSRWFVFSISPRRPPAAPPTPGAAPRPPSPSKVALLNLTSGEKVEFESVRRFAFSGDAPTHLAMHRSAPPGPVGPPAPGTPPPGNGSDLILRELATGSELTLGNVADFSFDKKGQWLALTIDTQGQTGNGIQLRNMKTAALYQLDAAKATYQGMNWTEKGDGLVVLRGIEDKGFKGKLYSVLGFTGFDAATPQKIVYDPRDDKTFPTGMTVSSNRNASFSDDLGTLFFGINELKKADDKPAAPAKPDATKPDAKPDAAKPETAKPGSADSKKEKPDLVIWHWQDDRPQPMQELQAGSDRSFNYLCCYRVKDKKFLRLADDEVRQVTVAAKQRWAVGFDDRAYRRQAYLDGKRFQDVYVFDLQTGQRRPALKKVRWFLGASPAGTHFVYYDDGHFHAYDMATGKTTRITEGAAVSFINTEDDHNIDRPPTGFAGWAKDGSSVLLSDNWDLWQLPIQGGAAVNLTVNGRKEGIRYGSPLILDPEEHGYDASKPLYFPCHGEWTKKSGLARKDPGASEPVRLCWDDANLGPFVKARQADVFLYTRQTWKDYPDYCVCDATFQSPRKLTSVGTEQPKVTLSSGAMLVDYTSTKGDRLQGALFLPANYEKGKSYPTIVYIYERLSQSLHRYTPPSAGGFNPAIYTSNGYAVLMPDIKYKVNDPGMSAVWCVLPALDAAVKTGVVDRAHVGLHGHSWGGYQTAFLITQTDAFKAAIAGAPLTDLISMYSSMYWNTGSANQPIFESSQGRFTSGYWDNLEAYMRNSPVFHAKNVKTPLLLLHNDKDGAVDFTQGIEYFNTLRRLDKPVIMLQYKGENHGLAKTANQRDYAVRMREFFDHHLMGKPAPAWLKDGVPHLKLDDHLTERVKDQ
jgi:dipeptidyl aminopeptidase/acylaminoacyl peptidase